MAVSLSGITTANITVTASSGSPAYIVDASAFSAGPTNLTATGTVDAILYGGTGGHDTLTVAAAGSGNNILIGNGATDTLTDNGTGRNFLIGGGAGSDTITGNGNDILLSGTTNYDSNTAGNIAGLDAILAEWTFGRYFLGQDHQDQQYWRGTGQCLQAQFQHRHARCARQYPEGWERRGPEQLVPLLGRRHCHQEGERNQHRPLTVGLLGFAASGFGDRVPGSEGGVPCRVAPGDCSPRAPTDPYVPSRAYGSSRHELAAGRHTEWIATGGGSGYRPISRWNSSQGMVP